MTISSKRRWRWSSKGLFGPKNPNNETARDGNSMEDVATTTVASTPISKSLRDFSSDDSHTAPKVPSKKRRTHSKLLSAIGLQQNASQALGAYLAYPALAEQTTGIHKNDQPPNQSYERDSGIMIDQPSIKNQHSLFDRQGLYDGDLCPPIKPIETNGAPPSDSHTSHHLHLATASTNIRSRDPKGLRQSMSNPSLVHQLSHKLSQTFGNPTVVHRPNLRIKTSLVSLQRPPSLKTDIVREMERNRQDSTAPSTCNYSGSVSTTDPSTATTSLESGPGTPRSAKIHESKDRNFEIKKNNFTENVTREKSLSPIQEVPIPITPTFITVETTANAKIFFETYFNLLLAGHSTSRSLRRRDLELYFQALSTPEDQRRAMRWEWASQESDHLRQSRVLKTKFNKASRDSGVTVAGYEVVRILGKGSFGVVRLVREKRIATGGRIYGKSNSMPSQELHHRESQDENARLAPASVEGLKTSSELHKSTQRQASTSQPRRNVYAMKVIRKSDMLRNCQEGHLRAERDFLVAMENSRWVVPLIASFQDDTNLYLVMEYMVGGDFLGFLFRKDKLKEKQARWYIAEMILCVEETHRSWWIHRDIKPDNFLISSSGHLKISDFGLAFDGHWAHDQKYYKNTRISLMETLGIRVKGDFEDQEEDEKKKPRSSLANILTGWRGDSYPKAVQLDGPNERESILQWKNRTGKRRMAASVVGTSQYMAPEVIRGDLYDGRCDWWSIGIILYEDNAHSLNFPKERDVDRIEKVSFEAMDIINSLLQEKEHRLSSNKYKINDWQQARYSSGHMAGSRANPGSHDYHGNFVFPNDAGDIKAHPFFARISWERLHLTRPPWVPQVSGNEDTQWFDDEEGVPISDVDIAASESDLGPEAGNAKSGKGQASRQVKQVDGADTPQDKYLSQLDQAAENVMPRENEDKVKAKKRPRDKVLRDKEVGRKALELRKKGAFLGYTYRRPNLWSFEDEREKQRNLQRSLIPNFE